MLETNNIKGKDPKKKEYTIKNENNVQVCAYKIIDYHFRTYFDVNCIVGYN